MFSPRSQHFHLLLVVAVCHLFLPAHAWLNAAPKGRIKEDASYNHMYYVGENLTVHCIKFSDFTGEVYFQQGNRNYSLEYVKKINTTHALLDKPVTDDDSEETTLTCADGDGLVATAHIRTDYAPQNATDLKMVWLNEVNLFINWGFNNTLYKNGHSEKLILVTGEWCFSPSNESNWRKCYSGKLNGATCEVPNITSNEWATVYVRVNITNVKRKDLVYTVFPGVPIRDHVKPLPVKSVEVTALNSSAVRVHVTSDYYQQVYNITYNTTWGTTVMKAKTADKSFDVTGLHPDYRYRFSVSSKYDTHRGYLSDPVNYVTRMPEDVYVIAGKPNQKEEEGEADNHFLQVIKRANQEPVKKYKQPQTEAQEVGWITKPLLQTDRGDTRLNFFRQNSPITKFMDKAWLEKEQQSMGN